MMNQLLFGIGLVTALEIILALIVVAFVVYLCVKIPQLKPVIGGLLAMTIFVLGIFASIDCYKYFSAHNVTIGDVIQSTFNNKSEAEEIEGQTLAWDLKNLGFEFVADNTYLTTIEKPHNEVVDLINNDYVLYINDEACSINETGNEYVKSQYTYTFYDKQNNIILSDILYMDFGFYQKQTIIEIQTCGGETAVNFWKAYQVKNGFKFELKAQPKLEFSATKYQASTRTELLNNVSEDIFTLNIYVSNSLDYNKNGHDASDIQSIRIAQFRNNNGYFSSSSRNLHAFYKNSENGYNLYSNNFISSEFNFFDFGFQGYVNFNADEKIQYDGYCLLRDTASTNPNILTISNSGAKINLTDYQSLNPMGKILNIYVDLQEI